jgi:hypothetical protein
MGKWLYQIDINNWDAYNNGDGALSDIAARIVSELNRIRPDIEKDFPEYLDFLDDNITDFQEIVYDLEFDDEDEFDYRMGSLYDTGDIHIGYGWPPTTLIWIERN